MPAVWRTVIITALIACVAGLIGAYVGASWFDRSETHASASLDEIVHSDLNLTPDQERRLEEIEARYSARRTALELEMRAATREIGAAVVEDRAYTDRVRTAVDRFHNAMGELQHETILHVFEMRGVLTPEQQIQFDAIVRRELTRDSHD